MNTVVIPAGYPGDYRKMPWTKSWIERITAAGMNAIAYSSEDPATEFLRVLRTVDGEIAILACSANVPVALQALRRDAPVRIARAAFLYGYMLDVADMAAQFRFANPGVTADDIDRTIPLFLARAGRDETPRLNQTIDAFVREALARNMPLTLVNYPDAAHAVDTPAMIDDVLRFLGERPSRPQ